MYHWLYIQDAFCILVYLAVGRRSTRDPRARSRGKIFTRDTGDEIITPEGLGGWSGHCGEGATDVLSYPSTLSVLLYSFHCMALSPSRLEGMSCWNCVESEMLVQQVQGFES